MKYLGEIGSFISKIFLSAAACYTAYTAYIGVNTWQDQLKGENKHDLILEINQAVINLKGAIATTRTRSDHPVYFLSNETYLSYQLIEDPKDQFMYAFNIMYSLKRNYLEKTNSDLSLLVSKSEIILGNEIAELYYPIMDKVNLLKLRYGNLLLTLNEKKFVLSSSGNFTVESLGVSDEDKELLFHIDSSNQITLEIDELFEELEVFLEEKYNTL